MRSDDGGDARAIDGSSVTFVRDAGFMRDFSPGQLDPTARPFDVALGGDGFFSIQSPEGDIRYTRDGRFEINAAGQLATAAGFLVLDDGGAPIDVPQGDEPLVINTSGNVIVDNATVATLGVVRFDDTDALVKTGDGAYQTDQIALPVAEPDVHQGYVEQSNVNPIEEITRLIDATRTYQSVTKMISTDEDLKRRAIEKLSAVR